MPIIHSVLTQIKNYENQVKELENNINKVSK